MSWRFEPLSLVSERSPSARTISRNCLGGYRNPVVFDPGHAMNFARYCLALVGATVATLAVSDVANGAIVNVTYEGTVKSGFDYTGVFGASNTALDGLSFRTTYVFDTAIAPYLVQTATYNLVSTDPSSWGQGPGITASIIINGRTVTLNNINFLSSLNAYNQVSPSDGLIYSGQSSNVWERLEDSRFQIVNLIQNGVSEQSNRLPAALTGPFSGMVSGGGGFQISTTDNTLGAWTFQQYAYGSFYTTSMSVAEGVWTGPRPVITPYVPLVSVSAVPEPSTWACMMTGLALIGIALRGARGRHHIKPSCTA